MTINKSFLYYSIFYFMIIACVSQAQDPKGLLKGTKAPFFYAHDQFNNSFDLEEQLQSGPVVLIFYRGHWCKYCNKQLEDLHDSLQFILDKGVSIVTVTPEKMEYIDETSQKFNNAFKIISDADMKIMDAYKVRFQVDKVSIAKYNIWGIHLNEFNGDNGPNLPVPATYIIEQNGNIKYVFFNEDYKKRISVQTILNNL